jgi:hypothetical protein
MADTNSIFYKIGQATKSSISNAIDALKSNAFVIGTSSDNADLTVNGGATITGNLTVQGETTTLSTSNLNVKDNFIRLSEGASNGAFDKDQGFYFERASGSNAGAFIFDESEDTFVVGTLGGTPAVPEYHYADLNHNGVEFKIKIDSTFADYNTASGVSSTMIGSYQSNNGGTTENEWKFLGSILYFHKGNSISSFSDLVNATNAQAGVSMEILSGDGSTNVLTSGTFSGDSSLTKVDAVAEVVAGDGDDDTLVTTPAPLTVGSIKINSSALGNIEDFEAGLA